ncbi:hypothetical protein [Megasphaera cerevisiae]|nr:hypothetical protein [Megasphaera cerevisiae]
MDITEIKAKDGKPSLKYCNRYTIHYLLMVVMDTARNGMRNKLFDRL